LTRINASSQNFRAEAVASGFGIEEDFEGYRFEGR
jgi:hypothetical protein